MEIIDVLIEEEVKQSYIDYAMSVIVGRAIPDVRDGLKPVQRRILYAMHDMGLFPEKGFVKSARIVGTVLGYYHPHGDQAVYEALVRMAQDFNVGYPLVIGQGNFGSIDGDPPAAMRYTEAKLSKVAVKMLEDIDKNTVDFMPNFDGSVLEPVVLPSKFPNLLCNGTTGIAVGLATSIPPHNLKEVCTALIELAKNPDMTTEEIMNIIKGPDFPTGGIIENAKELLEYYSTGRGNVRIRAKVHVEKVHGGKEQIVITEIPYQVNKSELIKRMAELVREGKIKEISDIRDESDKEGIRIVIELKREANSQKVTDKLFRYTALRKNFPLNFVVLIDGEPKQVGIKVLLHEFIKHRLEVILRRSKYFLKKAQERLHITEGLVKALSNLDRIIQDIRASKDTQSAREKLIKNYSLTEAQANAVLDMKLQRLTSLERERLEEELKDLEQKVKYYTKVVENEEERIKIFIEETESLTKEFNTLRRSFVEGLDGEEQIGEVSVVIYANGIVLPVDRMEQQYEIVNILTVPYNDGLFMVSNRGRVYWIAGSTALHGSKISFKESNESIVGAFVRSFASDRIIISTREGYIKKIPLADFEYKAQGMSIIKFSEDDEVTKVVQSPEEGHLLVFTYRGKALRFPIKDVPPAGIGAKGVIAIKLEEKDQLVGIRPIKSADRLLVITEDGKVKLLSVDEIPVYSRGSKGVSILGSAGERIVDVIPIEGESIDILVTTEYGKAFYDRIFIKDIPLMQKKHIAKRRWDIQDDRIKKVVVK